MLQKKYSIEGKQLIRTKEIIQKPFKGSTVGNGQNVEWDGVPHKDTMYKKKKINTSLWRTAYIREKESGILLE